MNTEIKSLQHFTKIELDDVISHDAVRKHTAFALLGIAWRKITETDPPLGWSGLVKGSGTVSPALVTRHRVGKYEWLMDMGGGHDVVIDPHKYFMNIPDDAPEINEPTADDMDKQMNMAVLHGNKCDG